LDHPVVQIVIAGDEVLRPKGPNISEGPRTGWGVAAIPLLTR